MTEGSKHSEVAGGEGEIGVSEPLVSVYITSYNYEAYIDQSIRSVLDQTMVDFELIIIDDGSTDCSREKIRAYQGVPRVRVILQKNRGLNATNNVALRASRGKYLMRLDADDYLDPNALLVLSQALERDPQAAMVFPDYYYVDRDGEVIGQERRLAVTEETLLDRPAHGACTMLRRDAVLEVGGYSEAYSCQDGYDIWLHLTQRYKVRNVNLPLFYYRQHGKNLTTDEERLFRTRSQIFADHAEIRQSPELAVAAVLPVRGPSADPNCLSLQLLGDRRVIDWTIEAALNTSQVSSLIVTTNDAKIVDHVTSNYPNRVRVCGRDPLGTVENVHFQEAVVAAVRDAGDGTTPDAVLEVTYNYPFRDELFLEKAINVMRLHQVDEVIGVVAFAPTLFVHDGKGLVPFSGRSSHSLRLEKNTLYKMTGGMRLIRFDRLISGDTNQNRKVGHVLLSEEAATSLRSKRDLTIAEALHATR